MLKKMATDQAAPGALKNKVREGISNVDESTSKDILNVAAVSEERISE